MSHSVVKLAWEVDGISGVAKSVLNYLAWCSNEDGADSRPSIPKICRRTCHSENAVRAAIGELVLNGFIAVKHTTLLSGKQTSNVYRLHLGKLEAAQEPTKKQGRKKNKPRATPPKNEGANFPDYSPYFGRAEPATPPIFEGATWPATPPIFEGADLPVLASVPLPDLGGSPLPYLGGTLSLIPKEKEERSTVLRTGNADEPRSEVAATEAPEIIPPSPPQEAPKDIRDQLWTEGLAIVLKLTGKMNGQGRTQLGRFLKDAKGDCTIVLDCLKAAEREGPYLPIPWIEAAIQGRMTQVAKFRTPEGQLAAAYGLTDRATRIALLGELTPDTSAIEVNHAD